MLPTDRALAPLAALLLAACAPINRQVDHWALSAMAGIALGAPADARVERLPYSSAEELERLTRPAGLPQIARAPQRRWALPDARLTQEELSFASAVALKHPASNRAVAHLYRRGPLGARPLLVWVPGQAISAGDWGSLQEYFARVLDTGADLLFYVPPYHLERAPEGFGSGDALLATDYADHLAAFAQEISDLRRLLAWLRAQGVRSLGAFGSSMGGGMLLRVASFDDALDFLTLKQPLVDWNAVMARPELAPVRARIAAQGVSAEQMREAYRALDARGARPRLPPERISLFYGRFDQIAPEPEVRALAEAWGIGRVQTYERGHALIMLGGAPYRDVPRSLRLDLRALGAPPPPPAPAPRSWPVR